MHPPEPALTFTLPSIHDGTVLDSRVYHPPSFSSSSTWRPRHAAVVGHPYAPLGGCYDDPIVGDVTSLLLRRGLIVGTFNFRGAGPSAGRTSWTARPERDDYASMIGFLVYYIHHLDASRPHDAEAPVLLLAGYSYGAMITTQLPPLAAVLAPFATRDSDEAAGQIRSRAEALALRQRELMHAHYPCRRSLRLGEVGKNHDARNKQDGRKSHDGRRRFSIDDAEEKLKKGVHDLMAKTRHRHGSLSGRRRSGSPPQHPAPPPPPPDVRLSVVPDLVRPRPAHLLISPLQGVITHLATMSMSHDAAAEAKLRQHPTLAVYGDGDVFVSARKLRAWTGRMEGAEGSEFRGKEIAGAGHFWIEEGVLGSMTQLVDEFARELVG